jgi:hypothetical protein
MTLRQSDLDAEIDTQLPTNGVGSIHALAVRTVLHDINTAIFQGGGAGTSFAYVGDAQAGVISDSSNYITVNGYNFPGDGGAGSYKRVSQLASAYYHTGGYPDPIAINAVPPNITAGGIPVLVFASTLAQHEYQSVPYDFGPTAQPIFAGWLTVIIVMTAAPISSPASSFTDNVGNIYTLASGASNNGGGSVGSIAVYYNSNPVFVPIGSAFNISSVSGYASGASIFVYQVPGFSGAVLDQTANQLVSSGSTGGVTLSTGSLSVSNELVFGGVNVAQTLSSGSAFPYTPPLGWYDLAPPDLYGRNPVSCKSTTVNTPIIYNPTWTGTVPTASVVATFKTFVKTINPSFWELIPSYPIHTAQAGISPLSPDNQFPFVVFNSWLGTVAPASETNMGKTAVASGTVTIGGTPGNPLFLTIGAPAGARGYEPLGYVHQLKNGSKISLSSTGNLPAPLVAGQTYFVQRGSVNLDGGQTVQLSETTLFGGNYRSGSETTPAGTSLLVPGGGLSQSGTHSYTSYGEGWTDIVLDPGIYYATSAQPPCLGVGLRKWRLFAYGAKFQGVVNIYSNPWGDINANTSGSRLVFQTQFHTTNNDGGTFPSSITLLSPALAVNFFVNSWVLLQCCETMGQNVLANWNNYTFEFKKISSINASTGVITFYEQLQYNYSETLPPFIDTISGYSGITGPASIVQLNDTVDQEVEIYGAAFNCSDEMNFFGFLSLRLVDCDIYGWGFKTGPFPSTMRKFVMERCRIHNSSSEVDKMIDTVHYIDCEFDTDSFLIINSATINKMIIERCRLPGGAQDYALNGTPKNLSIKDSFVGGLLSIGATYGVNETLLLQNSHISRVSFAAQSSSYTRLYPVPTPAVPMTFVNGTIKLPVGFSGGLGQWNGSTVHGQNPFGWTVPGGKIMIGALLNFEFPIRSTALMVTAFTIQDVYVDGSDNFCIDTDMAGLPSTTINVTGTISGATLTVTQILASGQPSVLLPGMVITGTGLPAGTTIQSGPAIPASGGGSNTGVFTLSSSTGSGTSFTASVPMYFIPHPCPRLTVINCTGGSFVSDMSGAPSDVPVFSYFRRQYSGGAASVPRFDRQCMPLAGYLDTCTINVIKPYSGLGAGTCTISMLGWVKSGSNTYPWYKNQVIDLKTPGIRTITALGVTALGADSITAVPFFLFGGHAVVISANDGADNLAKYATFIITARTHQGIESDSLLTTVSTSAYPDYIAGTVCQAFTQS